MKKFLAILIFLFSVLPALSCGFLFLATNSWLLDRQFYIDMIDDERFYDVLLQPDLLPPDLQTVIESNDIPVPAVTAALREVITPAYMRDQAVGAVNTLFDVFDGKQQQLIFDIDTRPVKESLNGDGADKFAQTLVAGLPACNAGEEPYAAGGAIMRCIPAGRSEESAVIAIKEALPSILQKLPDTLHFDASEALEQSMRNSSTRLSGFDTPEELMTLIRDSLGSTVTITLVIGIFFLLIGMLLWSDTWQGRLQYAGVALALSAATVLLIGLSLSGMGSGVSSIMTTGRLTINGAPASPEMRQAISAVISPALSHIGNSFSSTGAVAGGLGIVIFLIGTVLLRPRHDDMYYENEPMKPKNG
jgi:hypothetical protein